MNNKKGFTLVELIVVITILAILGTIAFISLQGYSADARNSVRSSDINNITKSLELYTLKAGKYPVPTNPNNITYSGSLAWEQGTFGENTNRATGNFGQIPLDPLTETEYAYSVTNDYTEIQVGGIMEGSVAYTPGLNNTFAGSNIGYALVKGNYNEQFLSVSTGSVDYILAVPSILASDITSVDVVDIMNNKRLVYNGFSNLPENYKNTTFNANGGFDFTSNDIVVYSGLLNTLKTDQNTRITFLDKIQNSYSGTLIQNESAIQEILSITLDTGSPSTEAINFVATIVNNDLGGNVEIVSGGGGGGGGSDWTALDPSCTVPDITIGTQTWAGCNSTLGTGIEYTNNTNCKIYDGAEFVWAGSNCGAGQLGDSTDSELPYFTAQGANVNGDSGVDNIWGKLYTHANATSSACAAGYHVPDDTEWATLESFLNGGSPCNANATGCDGLGWQLHSTTHQAKSIVEQLKIPLSGSSTFGGNFDNRGGVAMLLSSTLNGANAKFRHFSVLSLGIYTTDNLPLSIDPAGSVRCIKD